MAIQRWDAALAASPAEPHKLHEAKAQVSGIAGDSVAWQVRQGSQPEMSLHWVDAPSYHWHREAAH